jgi:hypothetical protein
VGALDDQQQVDSEDNSEDDKRADLEPDRELH